MTCPRCQAENREGAQFCRECGTRFTASCPSCAAKVDPGSKFCDSCGTAVSGFSAPSRFASPQSYIPKYLAELILTSKAAVEGERKQVTVLFADMKGSMELMAERDPEEARRLLDPVLERMIDAVHRYEGTVNQVMGDGIMALFGAPLAHEDHAVRACYAALRTQESIKRYAEEVRRTQGIPIHIRVGLNSGEVVVRSIGSDLHMDYTAVGQTTHLAARMEQLAMPSSILITPDTLQLVEGYFDVRPLGQVSVKGLSDAIEVYELTGAGAVRSRFQAIAARGLTRFVGRDAELEQLRQGLDRGTLGHGQVVALVGEPGVGKSRLVWEFTHSHRTQGCLVLEGGSVSYGKATPYRPVIDLLKVYCKIGDGDEPREIREKLTGKLLTLDRTLEPALPVFLSLLDVPVDDPQWTRLEPRQRRQHTLEAIKRLLLRESQVQPLVLVFEDLHWIDSETQALLDSLVESLPSARILLLVNYRPEYQHGWANKTYYSQLRLDPLAPDRAEELLLELLGSHQSLPPLGPLLFKQTEGNPFFLEESVRTLVETKILVGKRGAYKLTKPLDHVHVPATVQALLAARIDRLPPDEKRLLQAAAVVGKNVRFVLLQPIAQVPEPELREGLAHLQAAEFLYETSLFPDLEYTFKHALTHEVTYGSLLHERRRDLHRQVGEALEQMFPDRREEFYDLLARHFVESGDTTKGLDYSLRAAQKASGLYAHDEALGHYERARACAETLNLLERVVKIDEAIGDVYLRRGQFERAVEAYQRASQRSPARENRAGLTFKIAKVYVQFGDKRGLEFLHIALEELNPATQQNELAQATAFVGRYHHYAGQHSKAIEFVERARRLAEPLDDVETLTPIYAYLAGAYQHMARLDESMVWARRCVELSERKKHPPGALIGHEFLAEGLYWLGRWEEALALYAPSAQIAKRVGAEHRLAWAELCRAMPLHGKGDLSGALAAARAGLTLAESTGEKRLMVFIRALLCRTHTDLGADDQAKADGRAAVAIADELGDRLVRCFSRHALVYFHLQRSEWDLADAALRQWAELLAGTDNRSMHLLGGSHAAEVAWGQRRFDEALELATKGIELARDAQSQHFEALARRVQGQALASLESWSEAAPAFDGAVVMLEATGSRLELGRALYHRGLMRQTMGDTAAADADTVRARVIFEDIAAVRDLGRAERLLRR